MPQRRWIRLLCVKHAHRYYRCFSYHRPLCSTITFFTNVNVEISVQTEKGAEPVKVLSGPYLYPLITPDSKWSVAIKTIEEGDNHQWQLVRRNLQSGKEVPINTSNGGVHPTDFAE